MVLHVFVHSAASSLSGGSFEELAQLRSSASRAFVHQVVFRAQVRARFRGKCLGSSLF
ncbi:hypothetical protein LR48_Vigan08g050800 [Vigna angularis]|uniref:Uncharacterized protein n=1 Tax=Phaseolus angularis TaxID=3914 RepID=A0A0L9V3X1_PHAAN|nr:hypothetical protein LR48_Vigan08g050800 [Vigna angularis]